MIAAISCVPTTTCLVQHSLEIEKFMLDEIVPQNASIFAIYLSKYEKLCSFDCLLCQKWQILKHFVRKFHQTLPYYFGRVIQYKMHE